MGKRQGKRGHDEKKATQNRVGHKKKFRQKGSEAENNNVVMR